VLRLQTLLAAAPLALALATAAPAAGDSGLAKRCSYKAGIGDYQNVSYSAYTSCREASVLVRQFTRDGRRAPRIGTRRGYTPHGVWSCVTVKRREQLGQIESTHRITCRLTDDPLGRPARVRFFRAY